MCDSVLSDTDRRRRCCLRDTGVLGVAETRRRNRCDENVLGVRNECNNGVLGVADTNRCCCCSSRCVCCCGCFI